MTTDSLFVTLVIAGVVCGLTPSLISIYLSLLAGSLGRGHGNGHLLRNSLLFISGFVGASLILGIFWWELLNALSINGAKYLALLVALAAIVGGLIEIKDYFWYGKGIGHRPHKKIAHIAHKRAIKKYGIVNSFLLGIVALAASVTNIGLSIIAVTTILYLVDITAHIEWLLLYSMALAFTIFCIVLFAINGLRLSAVLKWKEDSKATMRLSAGIVSILLAWLIILVVNTTVMADIAL